MDGHHKLIRYGMITHGMIDGFSRCIIYLRIADNNLSSTPLEFMKDGVREANFIPYRVRGDKGGENVKVADFMIHHRGHNSFICGPSKFNTRIERLWREVRVVVIEFYQNLFKIFEKDGMRIDDEYHMFLLQYLFMPRIQEDLDQYRNMHNNHSMRNEGFRSPRQMLDMFSDNMPPPIEIDERMYGVDELENVDDDEVNEIQQVELLPLHCPLTPEQLEIFRQTVVPLHLNDLSNTLSDRMVRSLEILYHIIDNN